MPKYDTKILFPYSTQKIYEMVKDIEKYPQFLPNCASLVIKKHQLIDENYHFLAEMGVKFSVFSEQFISNVIANDQDKTIKVSLDSGPLKNLTNEWQFFDHENGCEAHFNIQIEMKNFALRLALAAAFKIGVQNITKAFKTRADRLYQ